MSPGLRRATTKAGPAERHANLSGALPLGHIPLELDVMDGSPVAIRLSDAGRGATQRPWAKHAVTAADTALACMLGSAVSAGHQNQPRRQVIRLMLGPRQTWVVGCGFSGNITKLFTM
jgi:hypothetical protein